MFGEDVLEVRNKGDLIFSNILFIKLDSYLLYFL